MCCEKNYYCLVMHLWIKSCTCANERKHVYALNTGISLAHRVVCHLHFVSKYFLFELCHRKFILITLKFHGFSFD